MRYWKVLLAPFVVVIGVCGFRVFARQAAPVPAVAPNVAGPTLPIKKLILHTNGLALIRREAEVTGPATFELPVPISDVNDWLKSLDIDDPAGPAETVIFDSPEPIDRSLQTFAFDLTGNPAFGELLNQGRGEKVEVTVHDGQAESRHAGLLLGLEERPETMLGQSFPSDYINIRTDNGWQSIALRQVRAIKFINPKLDVDLQRSLALVASTKDESRKSVRVTIPAGPKRVVAISYIAEAPVWKVSYRLNTSPAGTQLRSWALVENTTDEDWTDVSLVLAGGRPISFQMDLYQPLFVPRPIVDLPKMAALRPPSYAGNNQSNLGMQGGFAGGNNQANMGSQGGIGGGGFGFLGGRGRSRYLQSNTLERGSDETAGTPGDFSRGNRYQLPRSRVTAIRDRASIQEYQQRQRDAVAESAGPADTLPPATDEPPRNPARYVIDRPITIPRCKSALIPVFSQKVNATTVAIHSPDIHATRPLMAMRVKNEVNQTLVAGPMTVNDVNGFAGDARITDWPAHEERFIGFALDSDILVTRKENTLPEELMSVRIKNGTIIENRRGRQHHEFMAINRGNSPRVLWLEMQLSHEWKLTEPEKPDERAKGRTRFRTEVPANDRLTKVIRVERITVAENSIDNLKEDAIRQLLQSPVVKANIRAALQTHLNQQHQLEAAGTDIRDIGKLLESALAEQHRLRTNLEKMPPNTDLSKRYLDKLGQQENEIEKLQERLRSRQSDFRANLEELKARASTLTLE